MNIEKANINLDIFMKIPEKDLVFFIGLGHLFNEINAISKLLYWISKTPQRNKAEIDGQFSFILIMLKIFAGKLFEGWRLFESYFSGSGISKEYDPCLEGEPKDCLNKIKSYFNKTNTAKFIRDNYGFHYSPNNYGELLNNSKIELDIYLEKEILPNNLLVFTEILDALSMLQGLNIEINENNYESEILTISDELLEVGSWFLTTSDGILDLILRKCETQNEKRLLESIQFESLDNFFKIRIPWFTNVSKLE